MKFSEILDKYYVLPDNQSEIVGFAIDESEKIRVTWNDSEEFDSHEQYFEDQEIEVVPVIAGMFQVTTDEDEVVQFIALDGVELRNGLIPVELRERCPSCGGSLAGAGGDGDICDVCFDDAEVSWSPTA